MTRILLLVAVSLLSCFWIVLARQLRRKPEPSPNLQSMGALVDATLIGAKAASKRAADAEALLDSYLPNFCELCGEPSLGAHLCRPPTADIFMVTSVPFDTATEAPAPHRNVVRGTAWMLHHTRAAAYGVDLVWRCRIYSLPERARKNAP